MSGIAGIVRFDDRPIGRERLGAMLDRLAHRGPDGVGLRHLPHCSLGAVQLSIIDLLSGTQPMHLDVEDGNPSVGGQSGALAAGLQLVFNGEIYNHRELRRKLERRGHTFRSSHSDTEVLLRGYLEWGEQLPKHLQGMWAFAVWDAAKRELFLCRDRVGAKPLYLHRGPDEVCFGSVVSAMVAGRQDGGSARINPNAVRCFLQLGYPLCDSMVDGVVCVPPAHSLLIGPDGREKLSRYWRPPPISKTSTSLGAVDALREVIAESVRQRLLADVPMASIINGGMDSALISAVAQRMRMAAGGETLKTLSMCIEGVDDLANDPGVALAKHLGTEHTAINVKPGDVFTDLHGYIASSGEPMGDTNLLRTLWLCRAAREHVRVLLTGNGGSELFGGWPRYRMMSALNRHRWWLNTLPGAKKSRHSTRASRMNLLKQAAAAGDRPAAQYLQLIKLLGPGETTAIAPKLIEASGGPPWDALPDWPDEQDQAYAAMRWDLINALPCRNLRRVDRASMSVALEVRFPFLGTPVLDLAGHLPSSVLMPHGRPMGLLTQVAQGLLPKWAIRSYRPFRALPLAEWLRGPLRDGVMDHLSGDRLSRLGIEPTGALDLAERHLNGSADHSVVLFALLQLAMWSDWLDDQAR